jgi:branched-chain amino acid aminotransferase
LLIVVVAAITINSPIVEQKKYSTMTTGTPTAPDPPKEGIDFDALPWNLNLPEEINYVHLTTTSEWTAEHYDPSNQTGTLFESVHKYSDRTLPLNPSTTSLNYGTTIWEGLKCFRKKDGTCAVFRPDRNFERFANGAEQMCLPPPSRELFLRGVQHVLQQNSHVIPPYGEGMKLYVRPLLMGSGQQLGLYPSPEFSLLFYVSPTVSSARRGQSSFSLFYSNPYCSCRPIQTLTGKLL